MVFFMKLLSAVIAWFIGGWFIRCAIRHFKNEEYYGFGLNLMFTIWEILFMIQIMFVM